MGIVAKGIAIGLSIAGASFVGVYNGVHDSSLITETTTVGANVDVPPEVKEVDFLKEQKFLRFVGATATSSKVTNNWTFQADVLGQKLSYTYTAVTTATYNAALTEARSKGTNVDPNTLDYITVEGSFGSGVQQEYRSSAKPMAQRTEAEKSQPTILTYTIEGKDLNFTPVVNNDPSAHAASLVARSDLPAQFVGVPSGVAAEFGSSAQSYTENTENMAKNLAYAAGVEAVTDKCGPEILKSPQTAPAAENAIKEIAVANFNATHPANQQITVDDVTVVIKNLNSANYTSPWTKELVANMQKKVDAVQGSSFDNKNPDAPSFDCKISETDTKVLNGK